jgi:hypothetical protein
MFSHRGTESPGTSVASQSAQFLNRQSSICNLKSAIVPLAPPAEHPSGDVHQVVLGEAGLIKRPLGARDAF